MKKSLQDLHGMFASLLSQVQRNSVLSGEICVQEMHLDALESERAQYPVEKLAQDCASMMRLNQELEQQIREHENSAQPTGIAL